MAGNPSGSIVPVLPVPTVSAGFWKRVFSEIKCLGRDDKGKQNDNRCFEG